MTKGWKKILNIIFVIEIVICIGIVVSLPIKYNVEKKEKIERANEKAFANLMACGSAEDGSRAREYWSQNGVIGWTEWDKDQIDEIYKMIADDDSRESIIRHHYVDGDIRYTYEEFMDMCYGMLYGGITFSEEMKMEMFYDVIYEIYFETRVNLKYRYEEFVYNKHGRVPIN